MILRTAILGSGKIGCDLLAKVHKSRHLKCTFFVGKRAQSEGMSYAAGFGVRVSSGGAAELLQNLSEFDVVFDATSALAAFPRGAIRKSGKGHSQSDACRAGYLVRSRHQCRSDSR